MIYLLRFLTSCVNSARTSSSNPSTNFKDPATSWPPPSAPPLSEQFPPPAPATRSGP